jgi:tripartite-type tricarboxylate transporter receptor subunit TctC
VYYKNSAEFRAFLEEQNAALGPLIEQLGLRKK